MRGEDVTLTADELNDVKADQDWIFYKVWEKKEESLEDSRGRGVDVLYVHGMFIPAFVKDCTDRLEHRVPRIRASVNSS
jgi:hypothetical protein